LSTIIYAIVFQGKVTEGVEIFSVKAHLAKLLKADAKKMAELFSGKPVVLKKTPDKEEALKAGRALKKIGAEVRLIQRKVEGKPVDKQAALLARKKQAQAGQKSSSQTASTGGLSLVPNKGDLFEARPAPKAPDLDLSGLDVTENDGSFLVESTPFVKANIDLSEYAVAENDGSPLVAPAPEAPRVDAPDFGLDAPGAVLETLKEAVKLVNPDVSNISLAAQSGDILSEDEKNKAPPPPPPDISRLKLAPDA